MPASAYLSIVLSVGSAIALAWLCLYATMAVHEAGHAAMHLALGGRIQEIQMGGRWFKVGKRFRVGLRPWTGRVYYKDVPQLSVLQRALVTAAGPAANLSVALLAFAASDKLAFSWAVALAWTNVVCGTLNLLPVFRFDGKRLLVLWMCAKNVPTEVRARTTDTVDALTFFLLAALLAALIALRMLPL